METSALSAPTGNPNLGPPVNNADEFAAGILPLIAEIQATSATTLRAIAKTP